MLSQVRKPGDAMHAVPIHEDASGGALTRDQVILTGVGVILLASLCVMPLWNAVHLMQDANFVFFNGLFVPSLMLGLYISTLTSYTVVILNTFRRSSAGELIRPAKSVSHFFLCLLGLVLVLTSCPLSIQASNAAAELRDHCSTWEKSYRLYEYSQVLHNIRLRPDCAAKRTVEHCYGYAEAPPYTDFLKAIEKDFACSGFCHHAMSEVSGSSRSLERLTPPTLFSRADFEASCEGVLARDMKNLAGDISAQVFYQGVCLLVVAGAIACTELATGSIQKVN
eukprot:TRINITY_DN92372_c0_g1_i1.p1 TRINITY_DN92372_c0_g1~~TRINITY_DN92372_c0_g1_i1.p1  ORF type:complete len:281 (-),score=54.18 TRINITY_DN92372_c0_g1_i1:108-950(-)